MKYTKTTIRELSARYRSVLKKCFLLNALAVGLIVATGAKADDTPWQTAITNTTGFMDNLAATTSWDRDNGNVTGWGVDQILSNMGDAAAKTDAAIADVAALKASLAGEYTGTTWSEAQTYIDSNEGKITTLGTTANLIEDFFDKKQEWVDGTLGITSADENAVNNEYAGTNYLTAATTLTAADTALDAAIKVVSNKVNSIDFEITAVDPDKSTYTFTDPSGNDDANLKDNGTITAASYTATSSAAGVDGVSAKVSTLLYDKDPTTLSAKDYTFVAYDENGTETDKDGDFALTKLEKTFTSSELAESKTLTADSEKSASVNISDYTVKAGPLTYTITKTTDGYTLYEDNGVDPLKDVTNDYPGIKNDLVAAYEADVEALATLQGNLEGWYNASVTNQNKITDATTGVLAQDKATITTLNSREATWESANNDYMNDKKDYDDQVVAYDASLSKVVDTKIATAVTAVKNEATAVFNEKQEWISGELGYDTDKTDAETVLAGFTDQTGEGDVGVADAVLQLKAEKQDALVAGNGIAIAEDGKTISAKAGDATVTVDEAGIKVGTIGFTNLNGDMVTTSEELTTLLADPESVYSDSRVLTEKAVVDGIQALIADKEDWASDELGYDVATTDANTVLAAKGFADQDAEGTFGHGKVSFTDAVVQLDKEKVDTASLGDKTLDINAKSLQVNGSDVLTTDDLSADYTKGQKLTVVNQFVTDNADKLATLGTTAGLIEDVLADKQAWVDENLGITSAHTNAINEAYTSANSGDGTNYLDAVTTLTGADIALDAQIKATNDVIGNTGNLSDLGKREGKTVETVTDAIYKAADAVGNVDNGYSTTSGRLTNLTYTLDSETGKYTVTGSVVENMNSLDAGITGLQDQLGTGFSKTNTVTQVIAAETQARTEADTALDARLDVIEGEGAGSVKKALADAKEYTNTRETAITTAYQNADNALDARLDVIEGDEKTAGSVKKSLKDSKDYTDSKVAALANATDSAIENVTENMIGELDDLSGLTFFKGKTQASNTQVAGDGSISDLLTNLNDNLVSEFSRVDRRINKLETKMEKGLAANNALAGLVPLDHVHKTQISAAMGGYKNNQALAVGAFHYLNDRTLLNAGAAYGGNDSVSYKVGVTFGF